MSDGTWIVSIDRKWKSKQGLTEHYRQDYHEYVKSVYRDLHSELLTMMN